MGETARRCDPKSVSVSSPPRPRRHAAGGAVPDGDHGDRGDGGGAGIRPADQARPRRRDDSSRHRVCAGDQEVLQEVWALSGEPRAAWRTPTRSASCASASRIPWRKTASGNCCATATFKHWSGPVVLVCRGLQPGVQGGLQGLNPLNPAATGARFTQCDE